VQKVEVKPQVVVKPIQAPVQRPSADEPLTHLPMTVSDSLKQALANRLQQLSVTDDKADGTVLVMLISQSFKNLLEYGRLTTRLNDKSTCQYTCS